MKDFNRYTIEEHERQRQIANEQAKQILEYRKKREEEMKQEDERKKQQDRNTQQKYAQTLKFQSDIAKKLKNNFG